MDPVLLDYKIVVDVYSQYTMILNCVLIENLYEMCEVNVI